MRAALVSEYRKLVTTRLWWVLLIAMAAYMIFLGVVIALVLTVPGEGIGSGMDVAGDGPGSPALDPDAIASTVYTVGSQFGYVFPLVLGTMAMTGEFRHQTVTPSLLAQPSRTVFLAGKLISSLIVGLVFGVVGTLAGVLGGAPVLALRGHATLLTDGPTLRAVALSALVLAIWTLIGVGFGAVLTNQIAAIVVVLAFTQFLEPIARPLLSLWEPTAGIAAYFPGAAGEAVIGTSVYSATGIADLLPGWGGLLVLVAYGLVLAVIGRLTTLRRDIT